MVTGSAACGTGTATMMIAAPSRQPSAATLPRTVLISGVFTTLLTTGQASPAGACIGSAYRPSGKEQRMTAEQQAHEPPSQAPDRNLALELARVTEAAAMAAARWVGRGDKNGADGAAVHAMRMLINSVSMRGVVVIGEGEKDHAPMLFNGEEVGAGTGPACDVAVDPIDGTTLTANGMSNAISVLAVAPRGSMYDPS